MAVGSIFNNIMEFVVYPLPRILEMIVTVYLNVEINQRKEWTVINNKYTSDMLIF